MDKLGLIALVFALVFFCIAAYRAAQPEWGKLIAIGLACWVLAELFGGVMHTFYR